MKHKVAESLYPLNSQIWTLTTPSPIWAECVCVCVVWLVCSVCCQCSLLPFLLGLLRLWFFLGLYAIHNISFVFFFSRSFILCFDFYSVAFFLLSVSFSFLLIYVRISFRVRWFFPMYTMVYGYVCVVLFCTVLIYSLQCTLLHMSSITACVCIVWSNL